MEGRKKEVSQEFRTSEITFLYCGKVDYFQLMPVLALMSTLKKEMMVFFNIANIPLKMTSTNFAVLRGWYVVNLRLLLDVLKRSVQFLLGQF